MALLEVRDLRVTFRRKGMRPVVAVDGVSFDVEVGETLGVVGESGCGKSVTALSLLGLLPRRGVEIEGSARLNGEELLGLPERELERIRGREIAMIFQDPMTSLNPVLTIGRQLTETLHAHFDLAPDRAQREARSLLRSVGIPSPEQRLQDYPHRLSGGMRQRAMIAMALACRPKVLIADEPTTALDVTIQAQILELLRELMREFGTTLILITHDFGVVAGMCERIAVMYAGRFVEDAPRGRLFEHPRHPYAAGLLASVPRLDQARGVPLRPIAGSPRDIVPWTSACAFAPRCPNRIDRCTNETPALAPDDGRLLRCFNPVARTEVVG